MDKHKNSYKKTDEDQYENYEPDHEELRAHEEALAEWKKNNPDWTDEDAAEYHGQMQCDLMRGK